MNLTTITNGKTLSVDLLDYGARIVAIRLGEVNVACRYPSLDQYQQDAMYLGATIGPITNRISKGQLRINQRQFQMPLNEGENTLHGGGNGFDKQIWQRIAHTEDSVDYQLDYDLTLAGMSGTLTTVASYKIIDSTLQVRYQSHCDEITHINLTNHVYLNLGDQGQSIEDHEFRLYADNFVNVDEAGIPTGELTPLRPPIQYSISSTEFSEFKGACDHHFNVGDAASDAMRIMLKARSESTGIELEVAGNSPGFQFFTGKSMGKPFCSSGGFCVETQFAPDAINQANFRAPILVPGKTLQQVTDYRFTLGH